MLCRQRRLDAGWQRVDHRAAVERRATARAVAAVAGAAFTRAHLDPVGVGLDRAAFGVDDRQRQRHVGRHLQLEAAVGFDRGVTQDLHLLEFGLADGLARAHAAAGWRHAAHGAHEARRRAVVGRVGRVLQARQVGHHAARVGRVGGRLQRDALRTADSAIGHAVGGGQHAFGHAVQTIRVVDAAHFDQRHVLRSQSRVHGRRLDDIGLGARDQCDRVGQHEPLGRRGHDQPGLFRRVEHVDGVSRRRVVLHAIGRPCGHGAVAVTEGGLLGVGERRAGHDGAVARHLTGAVSHQDAVGAVPQRVRRGGTAGQRKAAPVGHLARRIQRVGGGGRLAALRRHAGAGRRVVLGVARRVHHQQRPALLRARQRHQRRHQLARVAAARVHVARVQKAVAGALRTVEHEHVGAVGLAAKDGEAVAVGHVFPAREHDVAIGTDHGVALVALVEADLLDVAAVRRHAVQVHDPLALVLVSRKVGPAQGLHAAALGLAVAGENDAAVGRQVDRVDVIGVAAGGDAPEAAASEARARHVVFPDVPAARAGRLAIDGGCVAGGAAHGEDDLLAVVADLGVGRVALALREARGEVVFGGTGAGLFAQHQVAPGRAVGGIGGVHAHGRGALDVGDGHVAVDGDGVLAAAAAAGAGAQREPGKNREHKARPTCGEGQGGGQAVHHRRLPEGFLAGFMDRLYGQALRAASIGRPQPRYRAGHAAGPKWRAARPVHRRPRRRCH